MSIYKKLAEAKKEIGKISKDSTNPFFKSKYFDINSLLEHVEPILEKHGLMVLQPILHGYVTTEIHDDQGGVVFAHILLPELNDPQKLGSAITYYRRYTLQSLLALQASDDDGNIASGKVAPVKRNYKAKPSTMPWLHENPKAYKEVEMFIKDGKLTDLNNITKFRITQDTRNLLTKLIQG